MRKRLSLFCGLIVSGIIIAAASVIDAGASTEFDQAKQTFLKDMKRIEPHSRALAVANFAKVAQPATAELLIKRGVTDEDAEVRKAARKALRQLGSHATINQFFVTELDKAVRKSTAVPLACEYFRALVVPDDEPLQEKLLQWLDDYLATPKANLLVPMLVMDDFGLQGDFDALHAVKLLARAKRFDSHFGYRRCVVQAMTHIRHPAAVDYLIELLPTTDGLIQYDIIHYLTRLTKQHFQENVHKWAKWWNEHRDTFEFPNPEDLLADDDEEEADEDQLSYYGIPICAKSVVFVLDTSNSMHGQPMEAAKLALLKAMNSLPEVVSFDVVLFDSQATTWRPQLSPATVEAKRSASGVVVARGMGAGTSSFAALKAAFKLEPEAIYFISDGKPNDFHPDQILQTISEMNRIHRISINAVGLVTGSRGGGGGELRSFMSPLARHNWGKFRLIE